MAAERRLGRLGAPRHLAPARGRQEAVPLADTAELERPARRTRIVRLALAGLLVVVVLGAVASVPEAHGRRFLPADTVAMVVLDLS